MRERGQASIEWIGLIGVVTLLLLGVLAAVASGALPGTEVAKAVASRILCAARASGSCQAADPLAEAYGSETALLVRHHTPNIAYERGMRAMPVDFRRCKADPACGDGPPGPGSVWRTDAGLPVTAFTRVIDQSDQGGPTYIQYWLYYADSATSRVLFGNRGYHRDDWESYQLRLRPGHGWESRASSHHGYVTGAGPKNWPTDIGANPRSAWAPSTGWLFVAGGSHAGRTRSLPSNRITPAGRLDLIPLETLGDHNTRFAVVPPWQKPVYTDPESQRT